MERLHRAENVLLRGIEAGVFPGCAALVAVNGQTVLRKGYGLTQPHTSHTVTSDTLYDLASLTKPLACASSVMVLVERGELCLTDEVSRFFAGVSLPHLRGVTVKHLLTHTSGLPPWDKFYERCDSPAEIVKAVLSMPPDAKPGERYAYSDLGYILLGEIVRTVSGKRLDDFAREEVFRPLGMETAGYFALDDGRRFMGIKSPAEDDASAIAPTRHCPMREGQTLCGEVHDANCCALSGVSGHAGLFGTVDDAALYAQMLLDGGRTLQGEPFFSRVTVQLITQSQIDRIVGGHTLGWFAPPNGMHTGGDLWANVGFSHSGFTGTSIFADPATGILVVLLTNAVYFSTGEHLRVRRQFHNAVAASFVKG
jgi:CubicO group peptidase (beta-lactamase class C family)